MQKATQGKKQKRLNDRENAAIKLQGKLQGLYIELNELKDPDEQISELEQRVNDMKGKPGVVDLRNQLKEFKQNKDLYDSFYSAKVDNLFDQVDKYKSQLDYIDAEPGPGTYRDEAMSYTDLKVNRVRRKQSRWINRIRGAAIGAGVAAVFAIGVAGYNLVSKPNESYVDQTVQEAVGTMQSQVDENTESIEDLEGIVYEPTPTIQPTHTPQPTIPAAEGLEAVEQTLRYGLSKELAYNMYQWDPDRFMDAFGVTSGAQSQLPNWFDGINTNGEVLPLNGVGLNIDGIAEQARFYLFKLNAQDPTERASATFTINPSKAKQFTLDYLASNSGKISDVTILTGSK